MTHIESTLPEIVGSEVVGLSLRDADGLAAAALYRLVQKATGCRLPQTDSTPSSEVEELLALCSAVLRRHWQTPLTMLDGLSLQDLVSRLMADRVEGDATLGIPAVNGSVTEALSALLERKITGASEVADGMSLVQLLCSDYANTITEITDTNVGWIWTKPLNISSAKKVTLGCVTLGGDNLYKVADGEIHLPFCEYANQNGNGYASIYCEKIYLDGFKYGWFRLSGSNAYGNKVTKYLYIGCQGDRTQTIGIYNYDYDTSNAEVHNSVNVEDIEIRQGTRQPLIISNSSIVYWEKLSREKVREHIIDRLADNSDGAPIRIQLGTILSKLTEEDIAVATNKNYNLISF